VPSRPRGVRKVAWPFAVVALAVGVALGLLLAGVVPPLHVGSNPASSTPSGGTTELSAAPVAERYAGNVTGGPWSLYYAVGIDATLGLRGPYDLGCALTGSTTQNLTLPGYNGSYATGLAQAWIFGFHPTNGSDVSLFLAVTNGSVTELGKGGSTCGLGGFEALPTGLLDSSAAAQAVVATSIGASYVAAHPTSNASYALLVEGDEPFSPLAPSWFVEFTGCDGWNYSTLQARVNATSGEVLVTALESELSFTCGAPRPLSDAIELESAAAYVGNSTTSAYCLAGDDCYSLPLYTETSVSAGDLQLRVEYSANGTNYSVGAALGDGFSFVEPNGTIVAAGGAPTTAGQRLSVMTWDHGAETALTNDLTLWVDLGTTSSHAGQGLRLVATGVGPYQGTFFVPLP
jgi:hypothetical protein